MSKFSEDKLGWRQAHIRRVLRGSEPMGMMQIAEEVAMLCIDDGKDSMQDALDFLSARDGVITEEMKQPPSRIRWWYVDTSKSVHKLIQRGLVNKSSDCKYSWKA